MTIDHGGFFAPEDQVAAWPDLAPARKAAAEK